MPRELNPRAFPQNPRTDGPRKYRLPEFMQLQVLLVNFSSLIANERLGKNPPKELFNPEVERYVKEWLVSAHFTKGIPFDTAAFSAATLIRDTYQPPVLRNTPGPLKPDIVKLVSQIDIWMADGIRWLFYDKDRNATTFQQWFSAGNGLRKELDRIWIASGGGKEQDSPPNKSSVDQLERSTPMLDTGNGKWLTNKIAAKLEGVKTRTLADYRQYGIVNQNSTLGRDKDGRIWRRVGTPNSHPWYLKSSLISENPKNQNRR